MPLTLQVSGFQVESYASGLKTSDVPAFRSIGPSRTERRGTDDADIWYFRRFVPGAVFSYTDPVLTNWPSVTLDGGVATDDNGDALNMARICQVHFRCYAYLPDEAASGTAQITCSSGLLDGCVSPMLRPGGVFFAGNEEDDGTDIVSTETLTINFTSPVNLAVDMLIVGKKDPP